MIKALEALTLEQVNEFFVENMINSPRRMNVKLMSIDHSEKNQEEIADAKAKNGEFYE